MERSEKKRISRILAENRDWHNVKDCLPPANTQVLIRFTDPGLVFAENDKEILVAENSKIGRCVRDFDNPDDITKCSWVIDPPYPKYDFSPLANKDRINEGAVVTHWATPTQEDLNYYNHQFDFKYEFELLRFEVDQQDEEDFYKALMNAIASLTWVYGTKEPEEQSAKDQWKEAQLWRQLLEELLRCIDHGAYIKNGKTVKLPENNDPEDEEGGFSVDNKTDEEISAIVATAAVNLIANLKNYIKDNSAKEVVEHIRSFFYTIGVPMDAASINKVFGANWAEEDANDLIIKLMKELEE